MRIRRYQEMKCSGISDSAWCFSSTTARWSGWRLISKTAHQKEASCPWWQGASLRARRNTGPTRRASRQGGIPCQKRFGRSAIPAAALNNAFESRKTLLSCAHEMRILIATITAGGGHIAAAAALEEAWRASRPNDVLERIDLLKFFSPLHRKIHSDGYLTLVERAPELWGMVFAKTDNPKVARTLNKLKRAFPSNSRHRFERHVKHFKPDVVLCTHYLPLELLGHRRKKNDCPAPMTVSVITDFEAHALWMDSCVDLYCVAAEETKARLVARGASAENIVATGIPIAAKFSAKVDAKSVRKTYGLRDDQKILLVLSGGFGMGPVADILEQLDKVPNEFQTVVVTGRNEELRRDLAAQDRKHPTHI